MKIADYEVGPDAPIFLVAELGVTANGSLNTALSLVDAVADAGATAAKFICTSPDKIMASRDVTFTYDTMTGQATRPLYDLLKETEFSFREWETIRDHCHQRGVVFFATADHLEAVDMLEALGVPAWKVCAYDLTYHPLTHAMALTRKPILIDIGTAEFLDWFRARGLARGAAMPLLAPHPHGDRDWNFSRPRVIGPGTPWETWGFASPGRESWCDFLAIGLGACLLEKRLTLRRDEPRGHHHAISLEPHEFKQWVKQVRLAEAALREDPWGGSEQAWVDREKYRRRPELGWKRA